MSATLRQFLERIPEAPIEHQQRKLEQARRIEEHSITTVRSDHLFHDWGTYNCFEYTLGLTQFPEYVILKRKEKFANSGFIRHLIRENLIAEDPEGDFAIYFCGEQPKHAGYIRNNRVTSKWGTALVFSHKPFEVPASYGNKIVRYKPLAPERAFELFQEYAK